MASSKSQTTGIENIHTATGACISSLEACLSVKPLMKGGWAENRLADMNLWASGVGALARPKASLDRRLEFQPKARLVLSNLLLTLQTLIEVCRIHAMDVNSAKIDTPRDEDTSVTPVDMSPVVDSESASSAESWFMELGHDIGMVSDSSSDSYTEDQSAYWDHETKLKSSMNDIDDLIDQLIMLGFAIRKSGTAARLQKADKTFNPKQNANLRTYLESIVLRNTGKRRQDNDFDEGLTSRDRMHHANALREVTTPQNHLIIANLRRRHRFNYARRHQLDLGQQVAQPIITKSVLSTPGPTQYQSSMTRDPLSQDLDKPTMAPMGSATPTSSSEVIEARPTSETTASAVEGSILNLARPSEPATSVMSMSIRKFEYPSPPPISNFMRGFKCPCCYQTLPEMFHESSRWRKHLTEDLSPYTCPFSDCKRAEVLYISRTAWRNHVLESHGKGEYWECQACSGTVFSTAKELAEHNHLKHGSTISEDEIADLQAFCRNIIPPSISHCPLCLWPEGEEVLPDAMTSLEHIGSCIHEFSLHSLPWAKSLSLQGDDSTTISIPNVEEWLTGTVEKLDVEEIRDLDVRAFQPLPRPPRSPIQDPMHIPREYFAEISKYSSHAERGSHIPSGKWSEASHPQKPFLNHARHAILIGVDISTNGTVDELAANDTDSATTTQSHPPRPSDRHGFEIAIICSTALEADAIDALFDHYWEDDGLHSYKEPGDPNAYSTGVIGRFNVVLVYMPGIGKLHAASVAAHCARSFPSIKLALLVGICSVVPFSPSKDEIILGDIIISTGIIHYDFGRQLPGRSVHSNTLSGARGNPNPEIREVLAKLKNHRYRHQLNAKIKRFLDVLRQDPELHAEYPGSAEDKLFEATYHHTANRRSCEQVGCNGELVSRSRLSTENVPPKPTVHFGLVASGNAVMKSGEDRDRIALTDEVIAFEMEGAGVWDTFPCIIIKGGCDYADSHKSQVWQRYAAATAAACAKAFLEFWNPLSNARYSSQASNGPSIILPRTKENTTSVPRRHYLPFSRNADFTGRQLEIAQIQKLLFSESDGRRVALLGLGGMGKTQIALQLAYLIMNDKESDHIDNVIWMPALSMASFESECSKMITQFGIEFLPGETPKDTFKRFLCSQEAGKWLLIIDNADDMDTLYGSMKAPEGIAQFIPDSEHGYILFLTRSRQVAASVAPNNIVEVSELDGRDAEALLQTILKGKIEMQDKSLIEKLLQDLAYNPLAIAQVAAYMNVNEISVSESLSLLESSHEIRDEIPGDHFKLSVIALFNRSFDAINAVDKAAAELLTFMALLEPDAIPRALLLQTESEESTTRAIETLHNYGLLQKVKDGETFHMHRLLRSEAQRWGKQHGFEIRMRQQAFVHVANVLKSANSDNSAACRDFIPHALRLLTNTEGVNTEAISTLGYWIGRCLGIGGRIGQAVVILESVVEIQAATLDRNDPARLTSQRELASAYLANGQVEEAIRLLEYLLTTKGASVEKLALIHMLGVACQKSGRIKQAIELLEHVVIAKEAGLAENDPSRLTSQLELASTYQSDGQMKKAIELLEHAVALRERIQTETYPDRLAVQYNLGAAYRSNGQVKEAIELLSHVVLGQANTLTEAHPDRLAGQYELAMAFQENGQSKEAIGLLEQVVAVQAETLPEDHPDRRKSTESLQEIYSTLEP